MPLMYDIIKIGKRYQVFDARNMHPIGESFATRGEAEEAVHKLVGEIDITDFFGATETADGTVEVAEQEAKEVTGGSSSKA